MSGGEDCGWLKHLSGGGGCGRSGRRGVLGYEALSEVPGGLREVKGQGRQVTPGTAVALTALARKPFPLALLTTVAMETGTAGTRICKKLHPITTTTGMRGGNHSVLSNVPDVQNTTSI